MEVKTGAYRQNQLMYEVVGACIEVHKELKWALYEKAYQLALVHLLKKRGHEVVAEAPIDFYFQGEKLSSGLRADILVDNQLIIELKAVEELTSEHHFQLHTYMMLSKIPYGLLVNFHARDLVRDGLFRKSLDQIRAHYGLPRDENSNSPYL